MPEEEQEEEVPQEVALQQEDLQEVAPEVALEVAVREVDPREVALLEVPQEGAHSAEEETLEGEREEAEVVVAVPAEDLAASLEALVLTNKRNPSTKLIWKPKLWPLLSSKLLRQPACMTSKLLC